MRDQAAALRRMQWDERGATMSAPVGPPTIVLASGKGGVGKSVLSVLLASVLAESNRRVLLLEGSQNMGNLAVLLGVRLRKRLAALVNGEASPADLLTQVTERLFLLAGDSATETLYALGPLERARIHQRLNSLYDRFDVVVIDGGTELEGIVRVASIGATQLIVLTVPEPAALIGSYAVMKTVHSRVPQLPIDVLVNRVSHPSEGRDAYDRLAFACKRFLKREVGYLGALPEDGVLNAAARVPRALIGRVRQSRTEQAIRTIVAEHYDLWEVAMTVEGAAS